MQNAQEDLRYKSENDAVFYQVNAFLSYIKSDENTVYAACTTCKKKVNKNTQNHFECTKCDQVVDNPTLCYNLTTKIEDGSG